MTELHGIAEPSWAAWFSKSHDRKAAAAYWRIVVNGMQDAGTLTTANGPQIQRYAVVLVLHDQASKYVAKGGLLEDRAEGQLPRWNAWISAMDRTAKECAKHEAALGLTAVARGRATAAKKPPAKRKAADVYLLNGGKATVGAQ